MGSKGQVDHYLGVSPALGSIMWGLAGSGQPLLPEGVVSLGSHPGGVLSVRSFA